MKYLGTIQEKNSFVTKDYVDEAIANVGGGSSYDDSELREELAKKANEDGVYPQMTVGMTRDMLGVSEGAPAEFTFRPTDGDGSIKDGFASIERIEGNSVVWNQLLKNDDQGGSVNGLTVTNNRDGSWTASGTPSADVWLPTDQYPFASIVGHKYLLYGCPQGGNVGTYCLFEANGGLSPDEGNGSITAVNSTELRPFIVIRGGVVCNNLVFKPRVVDLTKMFGAGNEPLTIEEFYQRIPQGIDINAYNEGEVVDMRAEGIKSVGFNQWKAQPSFSSAEYGQNYAVSLENNAEAIESLKTIYSLLADGHNVFFNAKTSGTDQGWSIGTMALVYNGGVFDAVLVPNIVNEANRFAHLDKDAIKNAQGAIIYGTSLSSWSVSDICINLVHTGYRNGEYEPYTSEEIALPTMTYFPQGMRSIGKVCDEITQKQTIQRIGAVDLGTLPWFRETGKDGAVIMMSNGIANLAVLPSDSTTKGNLICAKYITQSAYAVVQNAMGVSINPSGDIIIYDSAYTDAASFKAAMKGVILYYELAEPIVTDIQEPLNLDYQVWDFGTEQAISSQKSTQFKGSIIYEFNARDTIRKNKHDIATLNAEILQLKSLVQEVTNNVGPYVLKNTILDLNRAIKYNEGEQNISDIAEIRTALANHRAIHIKYGSNFDGYFVVNGYIDGTDMITLEFWFGATQYAIEIDTTSGIGYVSTYDA